MSNPTSRTEYLEHFSAEPLERTRQTEALRLAHEIRQFEIELYWKRAAYFWTFIAAALAGYFALQQSSTYSFESTYIVSCLGFIFSLAWYLVNRGSKSWQRNWEAQVDLLEDEITGPLYKSEINRFQHSFWDLTAGYHFSPSRINQLLGVVIILVWLGLVIRTLFTGNWSNVYEVWVTVLMSSLTLAASIAFGVWGRSSESVGVREVRHSLRSYRAE